MGFKITGAGEKRARLVFEGDYAGAEVVVRVNVPMRVFAESQRVAETKEWEQFVDYFVAEVIREWNLEDDAGKPVPVNSEGVKLVPFDFLMLIVSEWGKLVGDVPGPLGHGSSNGKPSVEAFLPMESK